MSAATVTGNGHAHPFKCDCSLEIYLYLNDAQKISASIAASDIWRCENGGIGKSTSSSLAFNSHDEYAIRDGKFALSEHYSVLWRKFPLAVWASHHVTPNALQIALPLASLVGLLRGLSGAESRLFNDLLKKRLR
ncbi:hypothetical protein [Pandoraea cepalis]|uniref:hypothetical protein n=1 Tax=Pandoraea cepalis TaxID=2508294 RepID=UPI00263BBB8D|nr:hypothetical protein [Pandoraea cepalis]